MFALITGLYRAFEQGATMSVIADRHANDPVAMADGIRTFLFPGEALSPREHLSVGETVTDPVTFTPAEEVEELVAA